MPVIDGFHAYIGWNIDQSVAGASEIFDTAGVTASSVYVNAGTGTDYVITGVGDDTVFGGLAADVIRTSGGNDTIYGDRYWDDESHYAVLHAPPYVGHDAILSGDRNDVVFAGGGDDKVNAGAGNDHVSGWTGNDVIFGGEGRDFLYGGDGNDTIHAATPDSFSDLVYTAIRVGLDGITGGSLGGSLYIGSEITGLGETATTDSDFGLIDGGDGNDLIVGGVAADALIGGGSLDTIDGGSGNDGIDGGNDRDIIGGGAGDDVLLGGDGHDHLDGSTGNDHLRGDAGEDLLIGGTGTDVTYGGEGSDVFLFRAGDGPDILMDFVPGAQADSVALVGTGLSSFAEVQARISFYPAGNATLLQIGSDQIFFSGVTPDQFDGSDFFFF